MFLISEFCLSLIYKFVPQFPDPKCLRFAILTQLQCVCTKIALIEKNISKEKKSQTSFCCLCVNKPTVKI